MNWFQARETTMHLVFLNRVTGEVIVWKVDNAYDKLLAFYSNVRS